MKTHGSTMYNYLLYIHTQKHTVHLLYIMYYDILSQVDWVLCKQT